MSTWHPSQLPRGEGRVRLEQRGDHAELILDSPAARNAISPGMMVDLGEHVAELERASGRSLIVRGEGDAFCAGGNLAAVREHLLEPGSGAAMCAYMTALLDRLSRLPRLVVAAVEGAALGGGAELLTAADLVIASDEARVGFVQAALGVSPGWGGGRRLVRRVGPRRAVPILALAEVMSASEAMAAGLVDLLAPAGGALERARARVATLDRVDPEALRAALLVGRGASVETEARLFGELWGGPAHRDALGRTRKGRA